MTNLNGKWAVLAIVGTKLALLTAATFSGSVPVLALKKSSTATPLHIKGVKLLHVHTFKPSFVAVGSIFSIRAIVFNNSSSTITFANGTCTSQLSVRFNKNVMIEPQPAAASCKAPPHSVALKPGEQALISSPNLSGIAYRATSPGMTNATMTFKYGVEANTGKSPIGDSISKVLTFNILDSGPQPAGPHSSSQPSPLKLPVP
ncbi:MAG TPA: hypothetical protein VFI73_00180 [Candidatus Nitrosopolaris sp.]|nr:hypothetical protein [Candidatus Nitrosopolaris sp.]